MTDIATEAAIDIAQQRLTGERALFRATGAHVADSVFADGESPLKEAAGVTVDHGTFAWKYPLWYAADADVRGSALLETARSGVWYATDVRITRSTVGTSAGA